MDIAAEMARRLDVKLLLLHVEGFRGLAAIDPALFEAVVSKNREELASRGGAFAQSGHADRRETFVGLCLQRDCGCRGRVQRLG